MGLEDTYKIDIIQQAENGKVRLCIVDAGITPEPKKRFELLIQNLKNYCAWVETEECQKEHPGLSLKNICITVACATPPTSEMLEIEALTNPHHPDVSVPVQFVEQPLQW